MVIESLKCYLLHVLWQSHQADRTGAEHRPANKTNSGSNRHPVNSKTPLKDCGVGDDSKETSVEFKKR